MDVEHNIEMTLLECNKDEKKDAIHTAWDQRLAHHLAHINNNIAALVDSQVLCNSTRARLLRGMAGNNESAGQSTLAQNLRAHRNNSRVLINTVAQQLAALGPNVAATWLSPGQDEETGGGYAGDCYGDLELTRARFVHSVEAIRRTASDTCQEYEAAVKELVATAGGGTSGEQGKVLKQVRAILSGRSPMAVATAQGFKGEKEKDDEGTLKWIVCDYGMASDLLGLCSRVCLEAQDAYWTPNKPPGPSDGWKIPAQKTKQGRGLSRSPWFLRRDTGCFPLFLRRQTRGSHSQPRRGRRVSPAVAAALPVAGLFGAIVLIWATLTWAARNH